MKNLNTYSNVIYTATAKFLSNNDLPTPPLSNQQRREITGKLTEQVRNAIMDANGELLKADRYKVPRELYAEQIARHGRKICVSEIRQSQGWRCENRANWVLKPFLTTRPGGWGGMRAACGVNAALTAGIR